MPHGLLDELQALHASLREEKMQRWRRDLPLAELIVDRWERAKKLGFGEGASIYDNSYVLGGVAVGRNTWIGPFTMLDGSGGLSIGEWCAISAGVQIYTHDSVRWALSGGQAPHDRSPVSIGDCCYIGADAIIARGVTIGHHSVVAACAFVNRDVPPYTIVGGCPAKPLGAVEVLETGEIRLSYSRPAALEEAAHVGKSATGPRTCDQTVTSGQELPSPSSHPY